MIISSPPSGTLLLIVDNLAVETVPHAAGHARVIMVTACRDTVHPLYNDTLTVSGIISSPPSATLLHFVGQLGNCLLLVVVVSLAKSIGYY